MARYTFIDESSSQQPESMAGTIGRGAARTVARAGESILGLPSDIASGVLGLGGGLVGADVSGIQKYLPTSQNIRKYGTETITGQALKPQGGTEEFLDSIVGDAATLLVPGFGGVAGLAKGAGLKALSAGSKAAAAKTIGKAFGRAALGNVAGLAAEEISGSPLLGGVARVGTMMLANTAGGRKALTGQMKGLYEESEMLRSAASKAGAIPLRTKVGHIVKKYTDSAFPDAKKVTAALTPIQTAIDSTGKADVNKLIGLKQGLRQQLLKNEFTPQGAKEVRSAMGLINETLNKSGKGKKWYTAYRDADEIYNALEGSNYIRDFMNKHPFLQSSYKNPIVGHLLAGAAIAHPVIAGGVVTGALGIREGAKMVQLILKSPIARRYYKDALKAAFNNDAATFAKHAAKLDTEVSKFQQDNPGFASSKFELID